jgi:hypothetical protein
LISVDNGAIILLKKVSSKGINQLGFFTFPQQ